MAVGGLAVRPIVAQKIYKDLAAINAGYHVTSEIKWTTAKARRDLAHKAYLDLMFALIEANLVHFHIRFSPLALYDHRLSGERRKSDTVSKAYYQLLLHRAARYYKAGDIHVRPDNGVCTELLPRFITALNQDCARKFSNSDWPFIDIECRNSASEPMLQLLDVSLGALASYRNKRHLEPSASQTKSSLSEYAFKLTKLSCLDRSTPITERKLSIWNVTPSIG